MEDRIRSLVPDEAKIGISYMTFFARMKILRQSPILVYTRSKVGSTAVLNGIRTHYPFTLQYHNLRPDVIRKNMNAQTTRLGRYNYWHGLWVYREIIEQQRPVKIVSLVRDPIGHALSHFFWNLDMTVGKTNAYMDFTTEELKEKFVTKHIPAVAQSNWFKDEFEPALGLDVFAHPFPQEDGHVRIQADNLDVLIMKTEVDNAIKGRVLADFLGVTEVAVKRENETTQRNFGTFYNNFKKQLVLTSEVVASVYRLPYARHFYSDAQLEAFAAKWTQRSASSEPAQ